MEKTLGVTLIERQQGSTTKALTEHGLAFLGATVKLLEQYDALRPESFARSLVETTPELRIGVTNWMLLMLGGSSVLRRLASVDKPRLVIKEMNFPGLLRALESGVIDWAIGPDPPTRRKYRQFRFEPLGLPFGMVVVVSPRHPAAARLAQLAEVRLSDLAPETFWVLPRGIQPGLLLDRTLFSKIIEVPHYSTMLAFAGLGLGLGAVPARHWLIDLFQRLGLLVAFPVPELGTLRVCLYRWRRTAVPAWHRPIIAEIEKFFDLQTDRAAGHWAPALVPYPPEVNAHRYLYYVGRSQAGPLQWRKGVLSWTKTTRGKLGGAPVILMIHRKRTNTPYEESMRIACSIGKKRQRRRPQRAAISFSLGTCTFWFPRIRRGQANKLTNTRRSLASAMVGTVKPRFPARRF